MTDNARGRTRILGSLRSADGAGVVRIEDRYGADIEDLWTALTDPRRLARWYGEIDGDLRPGGAFRVYLEGPGLHGVGRIEVCEPARRLRVATTETDGPWQQSDVLPPLDETLEATLTADGDKTILVIEARGMPLDKIAFYGVGWQIHAETLAAYLAGREHGDVGSRWEELVPSYQGLASTIS